MTGMLLHMAPVSGARRSRTRDSRLGATGLARDSLLGIASSPPLAARHPWRTTMWLTGRSSERRSRACHARGVSEAAADAERLAATALRHLHAGQIRLILVGGLPGTGKKAVAGALADRMGAVLLRTDQIPRELPGAAQRQLAAHAGYGRGLHESGDVHDTCREMLARARTCSHTEVHGLPRGPSPLARAAGLWSAARSNRRGGSHELA
ncbi:hypothetical protein BJ970_003542 [Saccharopolyspora phatthalungensis]|uniref:Uncharacterized protein n=1 Tax=Saccharopolyspora phatthalungensis TaxID=664693 RepID=A0A840QBI5_9PSEU|nr:hypothetical protein [Saccharopolyspora phatthalungensis]